MIKTQILLWKKIEGNRRFRVRVKIKFFLFYSELYQLIRDVTCPKLYLDAKKFEDATSDEHPHIIKLIQYN